jgi:hypothetical protein
MKKVIVILSALLMYVAWGWSQSTHIVQRGETYELIAKRYNISLNELMDANPGDSGCFIGMKLNIPAGAVFSNRIVVTTNQEIMKLDMASKHIKNGNYRKASSLYSDILKKSPTAQAYFGRAISYYNREKFKSAIDDFRSAMHSPDCTEDMKEKCQDLISDAEKLREEQHERRNAIWGGAAALALTTVATAYVASGQNKAQTRSMYMPPSNINGFQRDTSLDYLLDPQLAIRQVQQQEWNEYQTFLRLSGSNISFEQYQLYKYSSPQDNTDGSVAGTGIESTKSYTDGGRKPTSNSRPCKACNGQGKFERNDGSIPLYGATPTMKRCPTCGKEYLSSTFHRHENCKYCHGTGFVSY